MIETAQIVIQAGTGLTMAAFGISQIIKPSVWYEYVPQWAEKILPKSLEAWFMRGHGLINLALGVLFGFGVAMPLMAWITVIWWLSILPFAFMYDWRDGFRDITIIAAVAAVILTTS